MRVHLVDPAAYTPPYDRALASALARAGAEVALITSRFTLRRGAAGARGRRARGLLPLGARARAPPRAARAARAGHAALPAAGAGGRRRALPVAVGAGARHAPAAREAAAHPHGPRRAAARAQAVAAGGQRALYERMDAVIVHSEHGAGRLRDEVGLDPAKVHVIPHGVLDNLVSEHATPPFAKTRPVVLFFGLIRPYKGPRRAAGGVARERTSKTPSCGWWGCRAWTRPSSTGRTSARRCASSPTPSSPAPSARPISSSCPTARSTSPACCSPPWPSASRCCSRASEASRRSRAPRSSRPATPRRSRRR